MGKNENENLWKEILVFKDNLLKALITLEPIEALEVAIEETSFKYDLNKKWAKILYDSWNNCTIPLNHAEHGKVEEFFFHLCMVNKKTPIFDIIDYIEGAETILYIRLAEAKLLKLYSDNLNCENYLKSRIEELKRTKAVGN